MPALRDNTLMPNLNRRAMLSPADSHEDALPTWQVSLLRQHLGYLFGVHLLAAGLLLFLILDSASLYTRATWAACFIAAWGCAAMWLRRAPGAPRPVANSSWALRMLAVAVFIWSSPWIVAPLLLESEDLTNQVAAVCVLVILAAATSQTMAAHFPCAAISILSILLPTALLLQPMEEEFHLRILICLFVFVCVMLFICLRSTRTVLETCRLHFSSEHMVSQLKEQVQTQQNARDRFEKALVLAEQACMDKTRFLAAASHDLRQPIHAISLFVAALKSEVFEIRTRYLVDRLDRALAGLDSLFNCLLDISRLDAGLVTPSMKAVDAQAIAQTLESRFMPLAANKLLDFRVRCKTGLKLRSDPDLLIELLSNLLANAFRYTQSGRVLLTFREHDGRALVQIWDTGCGISEDQLVVIFDEFVQLNNPARDRRRGLGLGLSIVKRLANMLGHSLEVRSQPGRGSCFGLRAELGADAVPMHYDTLSEALPAAHLDGALVLVVDDEIDILAAMEALLSSWGCISILARSPEEAARYVETSLRFPDLIISDHRLANHQTSIDVVEAVSAKIPYPLPAIVISGEATPTLIADIESMGWLFMSKPVNVEHLRAAIARAMEMTGEMLGKAA